MSTARLVEADVGDARAAVDDDHSRRDADVGDERRDDDVVGAVPVDIARGGEVHTLVVAHPGICAFEAHVAPRRAAEHDVRPGRAGLGGELREHGVLVRAVPVEVAEGACEKGPNDVIWAYGGVGDAERAAQWQRCRVGG